eukprot:CAMPEP_0182426060 /NCGR_PEP_ID=MMETSP1167-20130531/12531_1 /TAXON_ID=2988 /ORGANISM="Mallomonas Sp, Strain CCMP3275" /LENGTH=453 /DNA_ID=CAMNT_0024607233 /DNA_START=92 /DNA_END=1453 /DNA_ORIENTATION=+
MGGGSSKSLLEKEQSKPIDASDIQNGDWQAAKQEIIRIRELLSLVDPVVLDRSKAYAPSNSDYNSSPSSSSYPSPNKDTYQPSSTSGRALARTPETGKRSLSRTPPQGASRPTYGYGVTADVAGGDDTPTTAKESQEGADFWRDPMGINYQTRLMTAGGTREGEREKEGEEEREREDYDATSARESVEGKEFWRGLMGDRDRERQRVGTGYSTGRPFSSASTGSSMDDQKVNKLITQITDRTFQRFDTLREAFLKYDYDRSGYISREEFRVVMASFGLPLTDEEFEAVNRSYPHKESVCEVDRGISYPEFVRLMTGQLSYVPGSGEREGEYYGKTTFNSAYPTTPSDAGLDRPTTSRSDISSISNVDRDHLSIIQNNFAKQVFSRYNNMKKAFKAADKDKSGYIEVNEFANLLRKQLDLEADDDEVVELLALFDTNGDGKLAYGEFVKCLHTY